MALGEARWLGVRGMLGYRCMFTWRRRSAERYSWMLRHLACCAAAGNLRREGLAKS